MIANRSSIHTSYHNFTELEKPIRLQGLSHKKVTIEDDVWIGTQISILPGVTIGRGSVIGAGAVVTKDTPPYSVAVGMPAKVIKDRRKIACLDKV